MARSRKRAARRGVAQVYQVVRRVGGALRRRARSVRRRVQQYVRQRGMRATAAQEEALVAALRASLPVATVDHGPFVSIVILNRDGREHLERCLGALASTTYRDVEIIVVDNGSTDGSPELAETFPLPFPMRVIRNSINRSFSEANGQAVAIAGGELICFLNNDVDPITDDWLGYMVETMEAHTAVAVGARLIYPLHRGGIRGGLNHADLTVQHAGVGFDRRRAVPHPRVIGAGEDPLTPWVADVQTRPALTAACLLVRADAFHEVGGFSSEYDYGIEDVDLCLKLRAAGGRLMYDGRAAMWHHESATRRDQASFDARVAANRQTFVSLWGRRIYRDTLLDALNGGDRFSHDPFHVAITVAARGTRTGMGDQSTGRRLGMALEAFGWRVSYVEQTGKAWDALDPTVEAIIVRHDGFDIRQLSANVVRMAWLGDEPMGWLNRVWFDEFDLVFAPDDRGAGMVQDRSAKVARRVPNATDGLVAAGRDWDQAQATTIRDALVGWASAIRYGLRIGVPKWEHIDRWGDYHFARGLQRSLERAGHPTRLHFLPDWGSPAAARDDVSVHLFGLKEAPINAGQVNVLWQISHPDLATPEIYERYDHVFVASDRFAAKMAARMSVPVTALHQATDPERFQPTPGGPHHELLFVASSRKVRRRIVDDLAGTKRDLAIYGRDWTPELAEQRFVKGEVVLNTSLARYYSAADIVLNDHWDDMRNEGFISNRIYDALACEALVISDSVDGIEAEFDGAVPTYSTRAELEPLISRYLEDPDERRRLAAHGRAVVLERHTFDIRVQVLRDIAEALVQARPSVVDDSAITP